MKTMNAIIQPAYGSVEVLRFEEVERPVLGDGEVRVRVHAAAVCQGDVHLLTGTPYLVRLVFGLLRPKRRIAGQEVAGTVEEVGPRVTVLKPGDEVYGQVPGGAFAEYVCAPADLFAPKPANLTFEQAAAVPISGVTALQGLRDVGQLKPGQKVLINGASGGVGTFAVQIAKALGAQVTAVCSTRHVDKVRSLGADRVIDYTREDFTRGPVRYDVMLDLVGNRPATACRAVLEPKGVFVSSAGSPGGNWIGPVVWMLGVMLAGMFGGQKMTSLMAMPRREDLLVLRSLIEAGKVTPVIERRYALRETAAALSHVAEGHAQGKTVILV
ncbi:NAD(P)-dependent alcohol dehydrogenase [Cystobacter fuscus]